MSYWGGNQWNSGKCTGGTHASLHLYMNQAPGDYGKQCGHCGNNDGNVANDVVYASNGAFVAGKDDSPLCKADVTDCHTMFPTSATPHRYGKDGNKISLGQIVPQPAGDDDATQACNAENAAALTTARTACAAAFLRVCEFAATITSHPDFYTECTEDVCIGGNDFADIDVVGEEVGAETEQQAMADHEVKLHCH